MSLPCPRCRGLSLGEVELREGLRVDGCGACQGIWLDAGELYPFVSEPGRACERLQEAYRELARSDRACPRCRKAMVGARLDPGNIEFEVCVQCGGNWFDHGEVEAFQAALSVTAAYERGELDPEKAAFAAVSRREEEKRTRPKTPEQEFWENAAGVSRGEVLPAPAVRLAGAALALFGLEEIVLNLVVPTAPLAGFEVALPGAVEFLAGRLHGFVLLGLGLLIAYTGKLPLGRLPRNRRRRRW